ncbi:50S ribosomal protein L37ae [Candidatus Woesearchaeota archaeon]|nr:50S ribosomal protein L37ae [Candidatus Woesearchaeota archaeon]
MQRDVGLGPVKRFGVRYGRTTKYNRAQIEIQQKKPQVCPYCKKPKAKLVFVGVYACRQCGAKFTGKAYFLEQKVKVEAEVPEEFVEESNGAETVEEEVA